MDAAAAEGAVTDSQALNDIQNYLVSFNKEISSGTGQTFILTSTENGTTVTAQATATTASSGAPGGGSGDNMYATDGSLLQSAAEVPKLKVEAGTSQADSMVTPITITPSGAQVAGDEQLGPLFAIQQGGGEGGLQVLPAAGGGQTLGVQQESMLPNQQIVTIHGAAAQGSQAKAVGLTGGRSPVAAHGARHLSPPQPQLVTVQETAPQIVAVQGGGMATAVPRQPESNYQTVTIVPSDMNQGGEVSYVLIVSQPDGEAALKGDVDGNIDMSVYDFKEEARGGAAGLGEDEDGEEAAARHGDKLTPKKAGPMLQTQLMCNYCNYTSPKRYLLTRHMKTHSEERPHKCHICARGFKTVASLQNHINTHTGVRPHKCKECDASFTTSGELVRHVRYRHTFEKPHKCPECDYSSVELSKLKRHLRSHTGERPYQCPHCSYASPDTYKLKRHLRIHTGEKPYECEICHARFTQSNSLKAHRLIHTGNKPIYQCELCPTTCGRKTDLKIHVQKLHTSEKPLQCKKCGKSFPDRYTWKIHVKTHEGEKCFRCELCPYAALSQRHLESHLLTHTGEKPFRCGECDQTFRQKQLLKRHRNLYHTPDYVPPPPKDKIHECSECHKTFAHKGNLLRHMTLHDPDNPEYQEALANMKASDFPDEDSDDEDGLDDDDDDDGGLGALQTLVAHPVSSASLMTETGIGAEAGANVQYANINGQQVQLQLVNLGDQNNTQVYIQIEGDQPLQSLLAQAAAQEAAQESQEEEEEEGEELEQDGGGVVEGVVQAIAVEEGDPVAEEVGALVVQELPPAPPPAPQPATPAAPTHPIATPPALEESTLPRRGARTITIKPEDIKQEEVEAPARRATRRSGGSPGVAGGRGGRRPSEQAAEVTTITLEIPEGLDTAEQDVDLVTRTRSIKRRLDMEEANSKKPRRESPRKKKGDDGEEDEDRRREAQKKKDIETCFGFDQEET